MRGLWYAKGMKNLFNSSFYRFTFGFIGILLASFMLAAVVSHLDAETSMPASAQSRN
jgi:hypothetical protein